MMGLENGEEVDETNECGENVMAVIFLDSEAATQSLLSAAASMASGNGGVDHPAVA